MKQRIFSKGKGWYISASNYKDPEDKAYMNLFFPSGSEPKYFDNGMGFSTKEIDILEQRYTSYKGKIGLTIFKYIELQDKKEQQPLTREDNKDMFGGDSHGFEQDELPFY